MVTLKFLLSLIVLFIDWFNDVVILNITRKKVKRKNMAGAVPSIYDKFRNYTLFFEEFKFKISLYFIFNEQNYVKTNGESKFVLSYQTFKLLLNKLRHYGNNSCGSVCQSTKNCQGHEVLELLQKYDDFMFDCVENRAIFYKHLKFIKTGKDTDPMMGYIIVPINPMDLGWDSWSKRMSYLLV